MRPTSTTLIFSAMLAAVTSIGTPAHACITRAPIELADIKYADVVVVGRISNYKVVGDPNLITSYARFDVLTDEILIGDASEKLSVTWDNSTFSEAENMSAGPFLIALHDPRSASLPLRAPSATILPNPEPTALTVLQAPCSDPFMFRSDSDDANEIRRILNR